MKFAVILLVSILILAANANFINRHCKCKAVSDTLHFPFHSWDMSSCKLCSCSDDAMKNCEVACRSMVESYVSLGCGKLTKGSKVKYSFEASNCRSGISSDIYTCA